MQEPEKPKGWALAQRLEEEAFDSGFFGLPMPPEIYELRGAHLGHIEHFTRHYNQGREAAQLLQNRK